MTYVTRLDPADYLRVPWKNGGGVSVTIAGERLPSSAAGDWSGVVWQLGRTEIVTPAPFSDLSGFERLQTVVSGAGLFLDTPTGAIDLSKPCTVARYDGGTPVVSRLTQGPVEVVNLIARRDLARIDMAVLRRDDARILGDGLHVIYNPFADATVMIDGRLFDLRPDHGLALAGPGRIACRSGLTIACTIERISPS